MDSEDALDAYSAAVVRIAETTLPSVAAVSVRSARGAGAGSASVISDRLAPADQRPRGRRGRAGRGGVLRRLGARRPASSGAIRSPTSPCCAPTGSTPPPVPWGDASKLRVGSARRRPRESARDGGQRHGGHRLGAGTGAADAGGPGGRRGDPDGCLAQPRQQRRACSPTAPGGWSASTRRSPASVSGWPCRSTRRRVRSSTR